MQKKFLIFSLIVVFALALNSCAGTNTNSAAATENTVATFETTAAADSSMDDVAAQSLQLAIGVINLRNSQYPVDATQAATLIPLFQDLQSLLGGTHDANQVKSAVDAIQAALTADQIQAITDMGTLTLDDLMMGGRDGQMNGTPDPNMTPGAGGPGGNGQGGPGGENGQDRPQGTPGAGGPGERDHTRR